MGGWSPVWECTNVKWWAHSEGLSLTGTAWCTACPRLLYTQLSLERGFSLDNQSRLPQYPLSPWAPLEASHTRTCTPSAETFFWSDSLSDMLQRTFFTCAFAHLAYLHTLQADTPDGMHHICQRLWNRLHHKILQHPTWIIARLYVL